MGVLFDPFAPAYMQRAWLELALLVVPAASLGVFAVLRRLAFATHALGVGTFPGAVVAFSLGLSAFSGGLAAAILMAGLLALLQRRRDLDVPAGVGLILAGSLALGSLLVSDVLRVNAHVDTLLFGSLLSVTGHDLARSAAVGAVVLLAASALGRSWVFVAFDRESARAHGLRSGRLDLALFVLLAIAVVASVDAVGGLLVSTVFVVPAATVSLFVSRLLPLVVASAALALVIATAGLVVSFHANAPPGATIAALAAGVFACAVALREAADRFSPRAAIAVITIALVAVAGACGGSASRGESETRIAPAPSKSRGRLTVVATTPVLADWARRVGGARVDVVQLLEPNVDPHEYEPTPGDAEAIAAADIVFSSGAGLDEFVDGLVEGSGGAVPFYALAPLQDLRAPALASKHESAGDDESHGGLDPHFWHDPSLAVEAVQALEAALVRAEPEAEEQFAKNTAAYVSEIESLDRQLRSQFASVPAERRKMVTDHDAFGYLARRYGIEIVGSAIPSTSTAAEPNARDIAELIRVIESEGVCSVFSESSVDPRLVDQVASEAGARVVSDLYGDTLGPRGSDAATYVGMMRHNARVLVAGFAC